MARRLLVLDFLNVAYRSFHAPARAIGPRSSSYPEGEPLGVTYGILHLTHELIRLYAVSNVAFALDADGPTFRDQLFPGYKGHRPGRPVELNNQLSRALEAIERMGYATFAAPGFEADDVMAALARQGEHLFEHTYLATGDHDMFAAVSERTSVLDLSGGFARLEQVTPERIRARYGLEPRQLVDLKALLGDSSDGFAGCAGLHDAEAKSLLVRYTDLAGVHAALPELPDALRTQLDHCWNQVRLARRLGALRTDVPVKLDPRAGQVGVVPRDSATNYLLALNMGGLVRNVPREQRGSDEGRRS
jgi:DNA polymerase-1